MPRIFGGPPRSSRTTGSAGLTFSVPARGSGSFVSSSPSASIQDDEECIPRGVNESEYDTPVVPTPSASRDPAVARELPEFFRDPANIRRPMFVSPPPGMGTVESPLFSRYSPRPSEVVCHGGVTVSATAVQNSGLDAYNRPGGLPLPNSEIYISPAFRTRLIEEINHTNRLYHLLLGTPYYSPGAGEPVPVAPTTEGGERISRALDQFTRQFGGSPRQHLPLFLLYCSIQQEDPVIFNHWVRENELEDTWELLTEAWSGRIPESTFSPHPLLNGMMVVASRRYRDHNYPSVRPTSGIHPTQIRPSLVLSGGWRGFLALSDDSLRVHAPSVDRRYRMVTLSTDGHEGPPNGISHFIHGNQIQHSTGFSLATPEMVTHFWSRLCPIVRLSSGSVLSESFWSVLEALGLSEEYQLQNPSPLWFNHVPTSYRTMWVNTRIPPPAHP